MKKIKVSVIIPNWNGEKLLKKNLPQVLRLLPSNTEVIIVDDGSTDGSKEYLKKLKAKSFKLKVIFNKKNKGFVYTANRGVKEAKGDFVALINTDVLPQKSFLDSALNHFKDKDVFAVSFAERDYGWAKIWWRVGFIHIGDGGKTKKAHISAWASGGTGIFRKKMWEKLGGFDPLYAPYYWEDFDLGFRAWKRGWKVIWEPQAKVIHKHESTTSKVNRSYVDLIKERNQLLFIWKNIDNSWLQFTNWAGMALRSALGPNYLKVIRAARKQYRSFNKPKDRNTKFSALQVIRLFKK